MNNLLHNIISLVNKYNTSDNLLYVYYAEHR